MNKREPGDASGRAEARQGRRGQGCPAGRIEAPRASVGTAGYWASPLMIENGTPRHPQSHLLAQVGSYWRTRQGLEGLLPYGRRFDGYIHVSAGPW